MDLVYQPVGASTGGAGLACVARGSACRWAALDAATGGFRRSRLTGSASVLTMDSSYQTPRPAARPEANKARGASLPSGQFS